MHYKITRERIHLFSPTPVVVMAATLAGHPDESLLRAAIHKAVLQHELLRCHVELDPAGSAFFVDGEVPAPVIVVRSVAREDAWQEELAQESRPFDWQRGEFLRFALLYAPENTVLTLTAHHLAGDGLAFVYLIRDILTALADPLQEPLPLPYKSVDNSQLSAGAKLPFSLRFLLRLMNRQWRLAKRHFTHAEYLAMYEAHWRERRTLVCAGALPPEVLTKLNARCKTAQVSVNTALVTAFLRAAGEDNAGIAVSMRSEDYEGMGNFATGLSVVSPAAQPEPSFWTQARTVHRLIREKLDNPAKKYFLLSFMGSLEPTLIDATYFSAFGGLENPAAAKLCELFGFNGRPKGVSVSNLGRLHIPQRYGEYTLREIAFVPPLVPNAQRIVGAATLGDTLYLTMHFDASREDEMRPIFQNALDFLAQAAHTPADVA